MKSNKSNIITLAVIFILFVILVSIGAVNRNSSTAKIAPPQTNSIYKTEEKDLKVVIGSIPDEDFGTLEVEMLDVRYALARLINIPVPIYDLPFYAMKDSKSDSFIGIIVGQTGEAIFLVSPEALNQTKQSDLEKSIKAINGTAKTYNLNLQFAGSEYDPYDILNSVK